MISLEDSKIVVVGGAGFIGSWVVSKLAKKRPEKIIVIDNFFLGREENLKEAKQLIGDRLKIHKCDAMDYDLLRDLLCKEGQIDVIFNLAVKPLLVSFHDPVDAFETSVKIAMNLLELQREELFQTLIHFSSSEAYGTAEYVPMDERHPLKPTTAYGAGKAAVDHLMISYYLCYGSDVAIIRPFNNFGPRQNTKEYAGVVPTTILKIMKGEARSYLAMENRLEITCTSKIQLKLLLRSMKLNIRAVRS